MSEIPPTPIFEDNLKVGKFNPPTVTLAALLSSICSLALMPIFKSYNEFLAALFLIFCLTASILGLMTFIWCFVKRKQFTGANNGNFFWVAVLTAAAAFTSPIWLIIGVLLITGFNR